MDTKIIETYVEKYINGNDGDVMPAFMGKNSAIDSFRYNTAKRLVINFDKFQTGVANKDVFLCSLRNYLLVFQNEISIPDGMILSDNEYGIIKNADGLYYASLEMPEYIDSFFVDQVFLRKKVGTEAERQKDVFYGYNAFIYNLAQHKYREFKSLEQKLAVFGALNMPEGYTTLVSLPTGGGKSLITQTMAYQQEGLTIVIVPTVSLAIDQVRNAKNNKLPDWERYFSRFAQNQFMLNEMVYHYEKLVHLFGECQRDNLNALWSLEELYVKNIERDRFVKVLEGRLRPIYDSAKTQGYGIWLAS